MRASFDEIMRSLPDGFRPSSEHSTKRFPHENTVLLALILSELRHHTSICEELAAMGLQPAEDMKASETDPEACCKDPCEPLGAEHDEIVVKRAIGGIEETFIGTLRSLIAGGIIQAPVQVSAPHVEINFGGDYIAELLASIRAEKAEARGPIDYGAIAKRFPEYAGNVNIPNEVHALYTRFSRLIPDATIHSDIPERLLALRHYLERLKNAPPPSRNH